MPRPPHPGCVECSDWQKWITVWRACACDCHEFQRRRRRRSPWTVRADNLRAKIERRQA